MLLRRLAGRGVECAEEDRLSSCREAERVGSGGGELEGSIVTTAKELTTINSAYQINHALRN